MAKFVSTHEKPLPHISLPDWHAKQWELRQCSNVRRSEACQLRDSSKSVRSEADIKTKWDTLINNARLADRVSELAEWRDELVDSMQRLLAEMCSLRDEKIDTEKEIESLGQPLRVVSECIATRDRRRITELTHDEADVELKKELCLIANIRDVLTKSVQEIWEKLNRLEGIKYELNLDIEDKNDTITIDKDNLQTDRTCANISYKPKLPINEKIRPIITYETWLDRCRRIKTTVDNELNDSHKFREAVHMSRQCARNDIRAQHGAADYALRKRIYQTQKARNELDWQKLKMQKEMEKLNKEIGRLEGALMSKMNVMKCAQTRLENRTYRTGYELCKDEVEIGLNDEVLQLKQTEDNLIRAIECAKASYNSLESLLTRINRDLDDKQHSLNTDVMCLDSRATLKTGDETRLLNETDRNIVLTRMEQEIPLEES